MAVNSNLQLNRKKKFYDILPVSLCLAGAGHGFITGRARETPLFSPRASYVLEISSFALKNPARAIRRLFPSLFSNKKFLFSLFEWKILPVNKVHKLQTSYILFIASDFASFRSLNFYFLYRNFLFNFKYATFSFSMFKQSVFGIILKKISNFSRFLHTSKTYMKSLKLKPKNKK